MKRLILLGVAVSLVSCRVVPDSGAPATPQRPTLSSDTNTTPRELVEIEVGVARDDEVSLDSPLTVKYGSGERTEVALGWSPFRRANGGDGADRGPGDVVVGLRHRFRDVEADETSYAIQAAVKLPTADDPELGTGEIDAQFAGIASRTIDGLGLTGYYAIGAVGDPDSGSSISHSVAIAAGHAIGGGFSGFGEVAAVFVPEVDSENAFTTLGLTYSPEPTLVLDAAVVLGLSDDAADWQALLGLTKNFGRLGRRAAR